MDREVSRIWLGFQPMLDELLATLPHLILALLVFLPFFFAARSIKTLVRRFPVARRHQHNLGLVLGSLAQWGILGAGILVALSIVLPSFRASDLIQLLGIGGVAIGFAFRDILQNFLAGILLLLTEPFNIGDQIIVRAFEGTVEDIQTRATLLRTNDGRRIVIPNSSLFTESVIVLTAFASRRLEHEISIGIDTDVEAVQARLLQALQNVPGVLQQPAPEVLAVQFDNTSVKLRACWWVTPSPSTHVAALHDRVLRALRQALQTHAMEAAAAREAQSTTPSTPEATPASPPQDSPAAASARPSGAAAADR